MNYDALFSPIKIRGLELKNRVVLPGMNTKMAINKHEVGENLVGYHAARAAGGCGLNIVEIASVCPEPQAPMFLGLYEEGDIAELKKITDAIHAAGGKAGVQIWHGGFVPEDFFDETNTLETPDTLTVTRIHEIVAAFGRTAAMAFTAGFDVLEFHAAHTYLPHEFLNPTFNKRTDEYGGSFENRCRFNLEVIRAMRANMPEDMPLFMRHNALDEMLEQNIPEKEIVAFLNMAADAGVDVADLSRGNVRSFAIVYEVPPFNVPQGFNIENIAKIKKQIKIPVCGVGRINDPKMANDVIASGKFDMVAVGRAQIADPEWCNKARNGQADLIRRCIACNQGCSDASVDTKMPTITCTRNPMVCLEYKGLPKTDKAKKVMVIGGGMAGLTAAEILKKRGHAPVIFEASDKLGGQFHLAGVAPMKQEMAAAAVWEGKEAVRLGIDIRLNTKVTPDVIAQEKPDDVIIAIGSDYVAPKISGIDSPNVYSQYQVLRGEANPTGRVAVVGCGAVGTEVAELLASRGAIVTAIEAKGMGRGLGMNRKKFQSVDFKTFKIAKMAGTTVSGIEPGKVHYTQLNRETKEVTQGTLECDAVVICTGITARKSDDLQAKCIELGIPFHVIGDAKSASDALIAAADGYRVGMAI